MGWSMVPTGITIVGVCVLFVFPHTGTFDSLMLLYPISWVITGVAMVITYVIVRKRAYTKLSMGGRFTTAA